MTKLPFLTTISAACENALDIIAVIDSSESVSDEEFGQMLSFLMSYAGRFTISNDVTQFGVVRFGSQASTVVTLGANTDIDTLQQSIGAIQHVAETSSNTAAGIRTALQEFRLNGRFNIPQVMLVFMGGRSSDLAQTTAAASEARAGGIELFSIGIRESVLQSELEAIASDPDEIHIFNVADFSSLNMIQSGLVEGTCNGRNSSLEKALWTLCLFLSFLFSFSSSV